MAIGEDSTPGHTYLDAGLVVMWFPAVDWFPVCIRQPILLEDLREICVRLALIPSGFRD